MPAHVRDNLHEHLPQLYRVALRILGDSEQAQEVVQIACVKALDGAAHYTGRAALTTWLHRITVNCAVDQIRRSQRISRNRVKGDSELQGLLAATSSDPVHRAQQRELCEIARLSLESLPNECRSAFILTQIDGYSYDEAAAIEGEPRGTIASRVFRAKKILMELLAQQRGQGCEP